MANQQSLSPFQEVHKKIREARERAQKNEKGTTRFAVKDLKRKRNARASTVSEKETLPHLIADGNLQRCSVCGYPFPADVRPSMSVAFAEHLMNDHKPARASEEVRQPATQVVQK